MPSLALAVRANEPYASIINELISVWTAWLAARILPDTTPERSDVTVTAAGLLATLDGLVLLHITAGFDVAERAARGLGLS